MVLSSPVIGSQGPNRNAGLVYCPLQRQWVRKSEPKPAPPKAVPLDEICAASRTKDRFFERFFPAAGRSEAKAAGIANLFFDFAKQDRRFFSPVPFRPNPSHESRFFIGFHNADAAGGEHFSAACLPAFATEAPAPHCPAGYSDNFPDTSTPRLSPCSSLSQPRAPPFAV